MARPNFVVQHFIAALRVEWEGPPGPNTARTLEGVTHRFAVVASAEPPFEFEELWLYARLYRTNNVEGVRRLAVRLAWLDRPAGEPLVRGAWPLVPVRFTNAYPTVNVAWAFRPVTLPGLGLYEWRLVTPARRLGRPVARVIAREYIQIERAP